LLLLGNGKGEFTAIPGRESGIHVLGQQRSCAVADYDADGRVDLVVTQNRGEVKLFNNLTAKPGIRVQLAGDSNNHSTIGAILRSKTNKGYGPAREIHAGSGYWSQDGAIQVLGSSDVIEGVQVRWPNGKESFTPVTISEKLVQISAR
jgi:enediyne biosynthesis protein E4